MSVNLIFTEQEHKEELTKAKRAVLRKIYETNLWEQIEAGTIEGDEKVMDLLKEKLQKQQSLKSTHVMITINPKEDDIGKLLDTVLDIITKKWVDYYLYCFEQRSTEENNFYGFHVHMLLNRNKKAPSEIRREILSTCKNIIGNDKAVDFKWVSESSLPNIINYIKGTKIDSEKMQKVKIDTIWRQSHGILKYHERLEDS